MRLQSSYVVVLAAWLFRSFLGAVRRLNGLAFKYVARKCQKILYSILMTPAIIIEFQGRGPIFC